MHSERHNPSCSIVPSRDTLGEQYKPSHTLRADPSIKDHVYHEAITSRHQNPGFLVRRLGAGPFLAFATGASTCTGWVSDSSSSQGSLLRVVSSLSSFFFSACCPGSS